MDRLWQAAPVAALRVRGELAAPQFEINDVARAWAAQRRVLPDDWRALAGRALGLADGATFETRAGDPVPELHGQVVVLPDGVLVWLTPTSGPAATRERADLLAERTRLVGDAIGVGFWSRDLDAGTVFWDDTLFRIHERNPVLGPPALEAWIEEHVHPEDRQRMAEHQRRAHAAWEPFTDVTCRAASADGREKWVQTWTRRTLRDGHRQSFGMHLDVSARVVAERALARERDRYRFAMEAAGLGVWERDFSTGRNFWNAAMYKLRGLDPDDPRPVEDLARVCHHPEDQRRMEVLAEEHLLAGTPYLTELRVRWPDGSTRWVATAGRVVDDPARGIRLMAGINMDVTERRQAEALREAKRSAEQASRDKSAFLARASHELRTPMNAILGFTELLARDLRATEQEMTRRRVLHVNDAAHHLLGLIDDILELSSLDVTPAPLSLSALDVRAPLAAVLGGLAVAAQQAGVTIDNRVVQPAWVSADEPALRQVLSRLLTNAIKFNRPGGWVRVEPLLRQHGGQAQVGLSVADSGIGIPGHQLAAVFQPFERAGAERGRVEGSGLGLAIVRQLVAHMQGEIELRSAPGSGSTFTVWLPAGADGGGLKPGPNPALPDRPVRRPFVALCIEDNPVNLQLVCELFVLRPAMVLHTASNGLDGVDQAGRLRPDLILLDMQLPDIDGHEVLRRLRASPATAGIRVVALTADAMPSHVERALAAGFHDYWTKPIDFNLFLEGLDRLAAQVLPATPADMPDR